jgi:hypothetical protein
MDVPQPYNFTWFGDISGPTPYEFIGFPHGDDFSQTGNASAVRPASPNPAQTVPNPWIFLRTGCPDPRTLRGRREGGKARRSSDLGLGFWSAYTEKFTAKLCLKPAPPVIKWGRGAGLAGDVLISGASVETNSFVRTILIEASPVSVKQTPIETLTLYRV